MSIKSLAGYQALVESFNQNVPMVLDVHPGLASIAAKIRASAGKREDKERFSVAVAGEMRMGKSTLVNALLREDLAPVEMQVTTATICRFKYHPEGTQDRFQVHWKSQSEPEYRPLSQVNDFIGEGVAAQHASHLVFTSKSDQLKSFDLVDTPGTRSNIEFHQDVANAIFEQHQAKESERKSLEGANTAHALIYAMGTVPQETDRANLKIYGEHTRMGDRTVQNTIVVMQKWEDHGYREALRLAYKIQNDPMLTGLFDSVIPTSGLIARALKKVPKGAWQKIVELCLFHLEDDPEELDYLLSDEEEFRDCSKAHHWLVDALGWVVVTFAFKETIAEKIGTGADLEAHLWKASGLEQLKEQIDLCFLERSEVIQAGYDVSHNWLPSSEALKIIDKELTRNEAASARLRSYSPGELLTLAARALEREGDLLRGLRNKLVSLKQQAVDGFDRLVKDYHCIELAEKGEWSPDERRALQCIFGREGTLPYQRLNLPIHTPSAELLQQAIRQLNHWRGRGRSDFINGADGRQVYNQADINLSLLRDHLAELVGVH